MVSQNGPPMPMPMQVPPGHIVQQIVDENGILTHVILSPQPPPGMTPAPSISSVGYYGPSGGPPQYYSTYPPYAGYTAAHAMGGAPAPHHPGTPSHQCNSSHTHGPQGSLPPHPNHSSQVDDRTQRMKERLQRKVHTRRKNINCFNNYSPSRTKVNGDLRRHDAHSSSSSNDGNEGDEEARTIQDILSRMKEPKVSNIDSRSALIEVIPPDCSQIELDLEINPAEFRYELFLSDKSKDGKYKMVYCGDATEITLKDLKPATDYFVRISSLLDDLKGEPTTPVNFRTSVCEPETPEKPKLSGRTKTSITLKWNAVNDNGAKISSYCLEFDQGKGNGRFVEAYNNVQRQFKVSKLTPATAYVFRLAAVNSVGKSDYSEPVCYCTSGSVPTQPDPPMLSEQFVTALVVSWIRRPNDDEFTLHMEDELSGHGFIPIFNGPDLSFKVCNLRRNTEYKFKLCARNEEGSSKFSDVVNYRTLPDRPGPCGRPQTKGKVHSNSFRVVWDHPKDNGGSEVTKYILEMDEGRGFEEVYEGPDREHTCDNLHPGHVYRLRTAAVNAGGRSPWSEMSSVTTQAVAPGLCQAPKLQGKPKATYLHLRWAYPDYDGGAEVIEYEVQMIQPDNSIREVYKGHDLDCMVAGLLPGRPYLYQVRATNKAGTGPWSDPLEVVSGPGAPDAPKTPTAVCRSPQSAIVSWEEPVNNGATITEYRLEWQQKPEADFTQLYNGSALNYEVRGLSPATLYSFRVQASNAAGTGPFSPQGACMTPSSSPSAVVSIRATSTAETITLSWKEPCCNGSEILSYNIDLGEKQHMVTVENVLEHTVHNLMPETLYKVRVQAVNSIGVGPFSQVVKVITRALPPTPPRLECVNCGPNSLKLKWGDGKNLDLIQYSLEMARDGGSFYPAYKGTSHSYKVSRLSELTSYRFRLYASNEAGDGPYSQVYTFTTTKAPPPAVRAPSVLDLSLDSCRVEWHPCKPLGGDSISYILQLQTPYAKDQEYKQIYHGAETSCRLTSLSAKTEYQVRVCAVRECQGEAGPLQGAFSPGILFSTLSPEPVSKVASKASTEKKALVSLENRELTDHQKAMIILFGFAVFAIIIAIIVHRIFMYYKQ
ncbi:fibronectin type-III domain-containing protein 3a-like isoform X1 [Lingula anatina]|uniref:Fibronectin type-III domain-containing protein 3a-like isoform X1 n=1 Tax=Lingula anatina TaxID=7574 RepID=A0A2R2MJW4_LINAN|nr:fibronectin type-III domain-containing protein 3a-like isoform X1 [Lingula anatina]|eukprot:XP_023930352.1 fibronectin type-III domain-containing protein 3a-like isoform X1 [Lingula anatina]